MYMRMRSSKMDQSDKGRSLELGPCADSDLCPVAALLDIFFH